jgi:hypothetical protein
VVQTVTGTVTTGSLIAAISAAVQAVAALAIVGLTFPLVRANKAMAKRMIQKPSEEAVIPLYQATFDLANAIQGPAAGAAITHWHSLYTRWLFPSCHKT